MARIEFPRQLKQLLDGSELQAAIRSLADRVGDIVADNKLPFFPDYTDHGIDHINRVLVSEVSLIPVEIWGQSEPHSLSPSLCDVDAAIIVGATLLHDIAMHLRPAGFLELIAPNSRFRPLPWFDANQEGHPLDRVWQDLWQDYVREARRYSERDLANIIGRKTVQSGWKFRSLPDDIGVWETNHHLLVGEFIRRHHARLAHEIAIYGFPGLPSGESVSQFPAIAASSSSLRRLADLIGLVARSHGTTLRICKSYLEASPRYGAALRPMGAAVLYPMALLRVADYLQLDFQRAPAVLLQLRDPQSPASVQEWKKHQSVHHVMLSTDQREAVVTVDTEISQPIYLQLVSLISGLQSEIDHATAVLDETYGARRDQTLNGLNLSIRRVKSNLLNKSFRDYLQYVPEQSGFSADANLLSLLVTPLYGDHPSVGVRELMQNSLDAVRELKTWCELRRLSVSGLALYQQESDILIELIRNGSNANILRITDRGIGMDETTIRHYFLRAGASFRNSSKWMKDFLEEKGLSRVERSGRFGIGTFAAFLLGTKISVWTRHVEMTEEFGYYFEATQQDAEIVIHKKSALPVGTRIEIPISCSVFERLVKYQGRNDEDRQSSWMFSNWPMVVRRINNRVIYPIHYSPASPDAIMPKWFLIRPVGYSGVFWTFGGEPNLVCNGIRIGKPDNFKSRTEFEWPEACGFHRPTIAVFDNDGLLPLDIQRYGLANQQLNFTGELIRDMCLSFVGHTLVRGPKSSSDLFNSANDSNSHPSVISGSPRTSLRPNFPSLKNWIWTVDGFVALDPWLYTLLNRTSCLVYGVLTPESYSGILDTPASDVTVFPLSSHAILRWNGIYGARASLDFLEDICAEGPPSLRRQPIGGHVIFSTPFSYIPRSGRTMRHTVLSVEPSTGHTEHELRFGKVPLEVSLGAILQRLKKELHIKLGYRSLNSATLYVANLATSEVDVEPESTLARAWHKILGRSAIPFDSTARANLVERLSRHSDLGSHVKAWLDVDESQIANT